MEAIRLGAIEAAKNKHAVVIFPEGTRSKDGRPKRFSQNGLRLLVENMPDALIVPVTINGSWKLSRNGLFPIPFGVKATWEVHPIIDPAGMDFENLSSEIEKKIKSSIVEKEEAT